MILFLHIFSTAIMTGIIWFVQIIHYPLFAFVKDANFSSYEREHIRLTKYLIMPAMTVELISAIILVFESQPDIQTFYSLNFVLLILIWVSTFFIQVPLHSKLTGLKDDITIRRLVNTNWIRTALWSFRLVLLIALLTNIL